MFTTEAATFPGKGVPISTTVWWRRWEEIGEKCGFFQVALWETHSRTTKQDRFDI